MIKTLKGGLLAALLAVIIVLLIEGIYTRQPIVAAQQDPIQSIHALCDEFLARYRQGDASDDRQALESLVAMCDYINALEHFAADCVQERQKDQPIPYVRRSQ